MPGGTVGTGPQVCKLTGIHCFSARAGPSGSFARICPPHAVRRRAETKERKTELKPYSYFSFGSDVRETAPSVRGLRASRGEASGPPANAETYVLTVGLMYCLSPTGVCFSSSARAAEAPASPDASCRRGTYFFARPKSKQKSRRECDSPLPTPVGPGNRTFPGQQPLPVLRYQCKKPVKVLM